MAEKTRWILTTPESPWQQKDSPRPATGERAGLASAGTDAQAFWGFGGCFNELGWIALRDLSAADRREVLLKLFSPSEGANFRYCRLPIGASDYAASWYSCNERAGDFGMEHFAIDRDRGCLLEYIQAARALRDDLDFFASPWSPPTWMKSPPVYNHGRFIMDDDHLEAYALYFQRFVEAYAEQGVNISAVHVQNEPVADQKFPSCVWSGEHLARFIGRYIGPRFAEHLPHCAVWLGTLNTARYDEYILGVMNDPAAAEHVAGVGLQWDGRFMADRIHDAFADLPVIQTENECGDGQNDWHHAGHVFNLIRHYCRYGSRAYVYWNMVLAPGGKSTWGWAQNSMVTVDASGTYTLNPEYYVMRHVSQYVQNGARRVQLTGPWSANAIAFANPDGSKALAVQNPLGRQATLNVDLDGWSFSATLPAGSFSTFVSDA